MSLIFQNHHGRLITTKRTAAGLWESTVTCLDGKRIDLGYRYSDRAAVIQNAMRWIDNHDTGKQAGPNVGSQ